MKNKKKLCLVIPSLHAGGMERVMSELASYFSSKPELEVHLVMYGIKPELFYSIPSNINIHKPEFIFNDKYRIWYSIKTLFFFRKKIITIDPSSILSFGEYWNNFVLIALFGLKYNIYVSDRCQPDKSLGKIHNALRRFLYPRAKGVIVQTELAKEIYQKIVPDAKLHVIGNPIRQIISGEKVMKENIILSVGRIIKTKHHDELIKLFVKINAPGWKLVIVGGDALKQKNLAKLQELVRELNAEDKVILAGSREDVDDFYIKSKIFAFTSSSEGFPNVIGEALSAGLPVVAFDCIAGPSEMIEDGVNGFLTPVFDLSQFGNILRLLMENEETRTMLGKNAELSIKPFSSSTICEIFYQTILPNE
jgi:GalNAc-alpha-(1->4)-GalNAc-alpha-(1->3)-diNAcBac-PP-undecaprenol alpha-1,4-N-acetyl-D-galactosaminyltransferase